MNTLIKSYKEVELKDEIRKKLEAIEKVIRRNNMFSLIKNIYISGFHADNTARDSDEIFIGLISLDDRFTSDEKFELQSNIEDQCRDMVDGYLGVIISILNETIIEKNTVRGYKYLKLI